METRYNTIDEMNRISSIRLQVINTAKCLKQKRQLCGDKEDSIKELEERFRQLRGQERALRDARDRELSRRVKLGIQPEVRVRNDGTLIVRLQSKYRYDFIVSHSKDSSVTETCCSIPAICEPGDEERGSKR